MNLKNHYIIVVDIDDNMSEYYSQRGFPPVFLVVQNPRL
jgi:hypothetical protein